MTLKLVTLVFILMHSENVLSLTVTSLPDVFFSEGTRNHTILVDSVIWLYCLANPKSPTLTVTWTKDNEPLIQDVPHIRLRSSDNSTYILIVEDFQVFDSGAYQCIAQDGNITTPGSQASLIANPLIEENGTIEVIRHDFVNQLPFPYTNRIGYEIGNLVSHVYVVGHVDDNSTAYQTPSVLWLKDGMPFRATPTNIPGINGRLTTTLLFTFAESDSGVYQVIINDTTSSNILTTDPLRLDSGETLSIKRVSPSIIILRPTEKLVVEVTATGRYDRIKWRRNGNDFQGAVFLTGPDHFANFHEVYFNEPATMTDFGVYEVINNPVGATNQIPPDEVNFFVIQPTEEVVTNLSSEVDASVYKEGSVNISCTSTGIPVPTITWLSPNQMVLQSDIHTTYSANFDTDYTVSVTTGSVVSTLHIVNAQYPADAGEYECVGSNSHAGDTFNSSAMVTLRFLDLWPLIINYFPEVLLDRGNGSLVEGSVVWLYCEVNSTASTLTVAWYKDGNPLVQDVPHIITRRTSASMFVLIVNDLQVSDSGEYQCTALDEYSKDKGIGMKLNLTVSSATNETLQAFSSEVNVDPLTQIFYANRAAYSSGDTATISCNADILSFIEVTLLKDGVPVNYTPTYSLDLYDANLTTNSSFIFTEFDAGVYQCVFINTLIPELFFADPIQIDTGAPNIERLSPSTIFFRPPNKLVMEVSTTGEYYLIQWSKNGATIATNNSGNVLDSFPHFTEIYFIEPTTTSDVGIYEVAGQDINSLVVTDTVQFAVVQFVDAITSVSSGSGMEIVREEGSLNISCTTTGVPVPTITWTFNNQSAPFTQTDIITNHSVIITGAGSTRATVVTQGNVVSTLHIVNPRYPANDGEYVCTGSNTNGVSTISTSAMIRVHIPVTPEIELTTDQNFGGLFEEVTLTCNVTRGNPTSYNYTWIHHDVNTSTILTAETSPTLSITPYKDEIGHYICEVRNEEGVGVENITIELQAVPHLDAISIPDVLFSGGSQRILEGSVVWLYCLTVPKSPTVTVTWSRDGEPLVQDVPHIHLRSTGSDADMYSTFLLVVEPVDITDGGVYQCSAQEGENVAMGPALTITVTTSVNGSLEVIEAGPPFDSDQPFTDHVPLSVGMSESYSWLVGHVGNNTTVYQTPSALWLKDGIAVENTLITNAPLGSDNLLTTLSFTPLQQFTESDAGVYQVVFTDTTGSEVVITRPLLLHTGDTLRIEALSPTSFILQPPEQLVLEIKASGQYSYIDWMKNGVGGFLSPFTQQFAPGNSNFAHFFEIYTVSSTTAHDFGVYQAFVHPPTNFSALGVPTSTFTVVEFDGAQTSAPESVIGIEGQDVNISCTSTGIPLPTITWTVSNQTVLYSQTVLTYDYSIASFGGGSFEINPAMVISYLLIEDLKYLTDDDVEYTCTGSNTYGEDIASSSASITLHILVPPVIEVRANRTTVGLLDDLTLKCVVIDAVPMPDNYTWIYVDTNTPLVIESNSSTITIAPFKDGIGTYRCEVFTLAGFGESNITIEVEDVPTLTAISLPDVLFSGGSQNILEGSVVWLYCLTVPKSPTVTVTWNKDGEPLVQDVPHIRLRSTGSDADMYSTFLLVVEPVDITDGGVYQCSAQEGENIAMGPALAITTVDAEEFNETVDIIRGDDITEYFFPFTNFESYRSGDMIHLDYTLHVGNNSLPSVSWLRDGLPLPLRFLQTNTPMANGSLTTELTFNFTESDGGDYQLVTTTTNDNGLSTMFFTQPIRLKTGETLSIEALSPSDIILQPTERLVLEVRTSGLYRLLEWRRNGILGFLVRDNRFLPDEQNFAHFLEIYLSEPIGASGFGVYDVQLSLEESTQMQPEGVQFTVTQYDNANTSVVGSNADVVSIYEGENMNISCISIGIPVPTITWTFNNQSTLFNQTDTSTDHSVTVIGEINNRTTVVTPGNVVSTLHIVNAQHPATFGEYVCTGSNTHAGETSSTSATITVQVLVIPVAEIIANVADGADLRVTTLEVLESEDLTLTCNVIRANPTIYVYTWTQTMNLTFMEFEDNTTNISFTDFNILDAGTHICAVSNGAGIDTVNITIIFGALPKITSPPMDELVVTPDSATLRCFATGYPRPIIRWGVVNENNSTTYLDLNSNSTAGNQAFSIGYLTADDYDIEVMEMPGDREVMSTLTFNITEPGFSGTYSCSVYNNFGTDETYATLTIHTAPIILFPPEGYTFIADLLESSTFSCVVAGIPPPDVSWVRQDEDNITMLMTDAMIIIGDPIIELKNDTIFLGEVYVVNLTLTLVVTMEEDEGSGYYCMANDTDDIISREFSVVVQETAVITQFSQDVTVTSPNPVTFICSATSFPQPTLTWFDPDLTVIISGVDGVNITVIDVNAVTRERMTTLSFSRTIPSVTGRYMCLADNGVTEPDRATVFLTVHVNPNITSFLPDDGRYVVNASNSVTFQCTATGVPPPTIQWFRNGQLLSPSIDSRVSLSNHNITAPPLDLATVWRTLTISNTTTNDMFVTYDCSANNEASVGMTSEIFELIVQDRPMVVALIPGQSVVIPSSETAVLSFRIDNANPAVLISDLRWYYTATMMSDEPANFTSCDYQDITNKTDRTSEFQWIYSEDLLALTVSKSMQDVGVDELDIGRYYLSATNFLGGDVNYVDLIFFVLPMVTLEQSPPGLVLEGSTVNLVCEATVGSSPINYTWIGPNGTIVSDSATIPITLFTREDYGNYTCTARNAFGGDTAVVQVAIAVMPIMVKFRLLITSDCTKWIIKDLDNKINALNQEIHSVINQNCQCNFREDQIIHSQLKCFDESPLAITFFSTINGTLQAHTSELVEYLESWAASSPKIKVPTRLVEVDSDCKITASSIREEGCLPKLYQEISYFSIAIIVGSAIVVVFNLLIILITLLVLFGEHVHRKTFVTLPQTKKSTNLPQESDTATES